MKRYGAGAAALTMLLLGWMATATLAQAQPAAPAQVLCLDATYDPARATPRQSLLVRELVRQAVLIAARDELGLATRDAVLREPFPAGARVFDVEAAASEAGDFRSALLERVSGKPPKVVWERTVHVPGIYKDLLPAVVEASGDPLFKEIAKALTDAGFTRRAKPEKEDGAAAAPEVEQKLITLSYFPQFDALRQLHRAPRSPAVLGGLVRGYANLGQLTQLQWNAAHQVFKARALLYAQRMLAAQPDAPDPLWHRAYAWTMTGGHAQALKDLSRASELAKAKQTEAPPWVALIDAACRYDTRALMTAFTEDRNAPLAPLAAYLCFLTIENSSSTDVVMRFTDVARDLNPSCLRLTDAMTESGGVGMQHQTTLQAAEIFKRSIFNELPKMTDLPQNVRDTLDAVQPQANVPKSRADIAAAVVAAGDAAQDTAEPSWAVLGRMMQDTYFAQTQRRVYFMAFVWGLDQSEVAEFNTAAKTLIGDHPYMPVLDAYAAWHTWPKALALLKGVSFRDVNWSMYPLIQKAGSVPELSIGELTLWKLLLANRDDTAVDMERIIRSYWSTQTQFKTGLARTLNEISPHSPIAVAALIEGDWDQSQPKVAEWDREFSNHPVVATALARQYARLGKNADAKRMWEAAIEVSPDIQSFREHAQLYIGEGDEAQWQATREKALKAEDYGLYHARVRVDIAQHFMAKGDYRRAQPYAEAAADTWAEWAMRCAMLCDAGVGDWARAEQWAKNIAERYETAWAEWFIFCKQTGKGNLAAAQRGAKAVLARRGEPISADDARYLGMITWLTGDAKTAANVLRVGLTKYHDTDCGMLAGLALDAAGDAAGRDAAWDELLKLRQTLPNPDEWRRFFELVTLFKAQAASSGDAGAKDVSKIEAHLATKPEAPPKVFYWAGRFVHTRGNIEAAKPFYARCAGTSTGLNRTMAAAELRALGVEPPGMTNLGAAATTNPTTRAQ
jgi:tetratricopeptide (TPR) repeat protein